MREILTKIQDIFPDKFIVGGSYARNKALNLPIPETSDIDIYTDIEITTAGLVSIFRDAIFKDVQTKITTQVNGGDYKQKGIYKRITIVSDKYPALDVMLVRPENGQTLMNWMLNTQASTLSEVFMTLNFSVKGYTVNYSNDFRSAFMLRTAKEPVRINCHTSVSTPEQLKKNIDFCLEHNKEFFLEHVPLKVPQSESLTEEDFYKVFLKSGNPRGRIL